MRVLLLLSCAASLTLILHAIGTEYNLYWVYWWFDIVTHLLGGCSIGFLFLFLLGLEKGRIWCIAALAVICIGAWEIFEIVIVRIESGGDTVHTRHDTGYAVRTHRCRYGCLAVPSAPMTV